MSVLYRTSLIALLLLASCERTPTKSDYVNARITAECAGRSDESFTLCRLEVIKKYVDAPLAELQKHFPPPPPAKSRFACSDPA